jgi:hypothetical protein
MRLLRIRYTVITCSVGKMLAKKSLELPVGVLFAQAINEPGTTAAF